ncbi:MAG: OmpA family protein [Planctomycetaceae bacterium]|nr:OmpA family protein [Planctomycetaceae bacterium]
MAREKKCPPAGAPEWMVTYGDMMGLLLTFFIMLYAMSSIDETKATTVSEAFSLQFGPSAQTVPAPGMQLPANSNKQTANVSGRARRNQTFMGGNPVLAPHGDYASVRTVRPKQDKITGGVIYFALGLDELDDAAREDIRAIADQLRGTPYKILVKGHTSIEPGIHANNLDVLAFNRAVNVKHELIRLGVDGKLIQVTSVGPNEPVPASLSTPGRTPQEANAFVEVMKLLELPERVGE